MQRTLLNASRFSSCLNLLKIGAVKIHNDMHNDYQQDTILSWSLKFLYILRMEVEHNFVVDYLFKDVCIANSLRREREHFPQEQKASVLIAHYERFEFPKLRVLQLTATHSGFRCVVFFKLCCENQGLWNGCKCWYSACEKLL